MRLKREPIRILGLDPGFARIGFGLVEKSAGQLRALVYGCWETKNNEIFAFRLGTVAQELRALIRKFKPQAVALEKLFFFKNVKTAIDVAQARGALILVSREAGLPVWELTPLQVKQSLSGYGRAEKGQIQKMVQLILRLKEKPRSDDAADALAIAIAADAHFI